jgi:hypothetical protein
MSTLHTRLSFCLATILGAGTIAYAQDEPAASKAAEPTESTERTERQPRSFERGFPERPGGFRRRDMMSPEQWETISQFMEENFPNRWAVYQQVTSAPGREMLAREMRFRIINRYYQLDRVRRENEALYQVTIDQARAEDEVWGTVRAWRELAENASASERETTLEKLREGVRALVRKSLDERKTRLASIREALAREEAQLEADRERIDKLVEARVATLTSDNPFRGPDGMGPTPDGAERPDGPGRPEGERRGPGNRGERRGGEFAAPPQPE